MSICCDRELKTPFCPFCGKDMRPKTPLVELRNHCAWYLLSNEKHIKDCRKAGGSALVYVPNYERLVSKWQVWVEALDKAIALENADERD